MLELPAGCLDKDEDPLIAAQREFEEETGYIAQSIIPLASIYENPVKDNNRIHLFLALDVLPLGQQNLDLTEAIEVILIPLDEVREKITRGEICVAGSLSAIFLGLDYLAQNQ